MFKKLKEILSNNENIIKTKKYMGGVFFGLWCLKLSNTEPSVGDAGCAVRAH